MDGVLTPSFSLGTHRPAMADVSSEWGYIKFAGPVATDNSVPVEVFTRALHGLQQTLLLIASSEEATVRAPRRFRPPETLRRKYELRIGVSTPGSLKVPFHIRDSKILNSLNAFLAAVAISDPAGMQRAIPDSFYREKAIQETLEYLPRPGQLWHAEFSVNGNSPIQLTQEVREQVTKLVKPERDSDVTEVVAELVTLNFAKEEVSVFYAPTSKRLVCKYPFDNEDKLFESRRLNVKITGLFERDEKGNPTQCLRVDSIEPFDLSSFEIFQISRNDRILTLDPPLVLQPQQDEESRGTVIFASDAELNLYIYAKSHDELVKEAEDYLVFLWDAYAKAPPDTLDGVAGKLAESLRGRIKESYNGA